MVSSLLAVLKDEVSGLSWMAEATRQQALAKLASYDVKVGYPDAWTDYSGLTIRRDAFWSNVAAARRFGVDANRRRIGQRVGRDLWQLPPSSSAAYIDVQLNQIVLPAGFLQPPAFDLAATDATNYGAIGIGVAHDLTHAIDVLGADFDATGRPRNWWVDADREAFQKLGQCVVDQYEGYFIEPGVHHQGKDVLGEAIGDLAGVRIAYVALQRALRQRPHPTLDGFVRSSSSSSLGPVPRRSGESGATTAAGQDRFARDVEVPRHRPSRQFAGVPASLRLPGRIGDDDQTRRRR